tara:strand:+ start:89 stop:487 length:399 start_codon:yes stop_codon:yes gene_type:complete
MESDKRRRKSTTETKACKKCGFKGLKEEHFTRSKTKGLWQYGNCKKCHQEYTRAWRYGITIEEMRNMLKASTNCAICDIKFTSNRKVIDHCHNTGKIRDILCDPCNTTLGHLEKQDGIREKFNNYIIKHYDN